MAELPPLYLSKGVVRIIKGNVLTRNYFREVLCELTCEPHLNNNGTVSTCSFYLVDLDPRNTKQEFSKAKDGLLVQVVGCHNHFMHADCLKQVIQHSNLCPYCRQPFFDSSEDIAYAQAVSALLAKHGKGAFMPQLIDHSVEFLVESESLKGCVTIAAFHVLEQGMTFTSTRSGEEYEPALSLPGHAIISALLEYVDTLNFTLVQFRQLRRDFEDKPWDIAYAKDASMMPATGTEWFLSQVVTLGLSHYCITS